MNAIIAFGGGAGLGWGLAALGGAWIKRLDAGRIPRAYWPYLLSLVSAVCSWLLVERMGLGFQSLKSSLFISVLLLLTMIDVETYLLPDRLTLPLLGIGLFLSAIGIGVPFSQSLLGALLGFSILWLLDVLYERATGRTGMGRGDFKLLAALGAWCGVAALPSLILGASLAGLSIAATGLLTGRLNRYSAIPFGPCLALAGGLVFLRSGA